MLSFFEKTDFKPCPSQSPYHTNPRILLLFLVFASRNSSQIPVQSSDGFSVGDPLSRVADCCNVYQTLKDLPVFFLPSLDQNISAILFHFLQTKTLLQLWLYLFFRVLIRLDAMSSVGLLCDLYYYYYYWERGVSVVICLERERCILFAYGPADATASQNPIITGLI